MDALQRWSVSPQLSMKTGLCDVANKSHRMTSFGFLCMSVMLEEDVQYKSIIAELLLFALFGHETMSTMHLLTCFR